VVDRTHQASPSVRSRRASIVREASQSEREQISTRTVTNYNHMHALTIEYYEVVQLYRMAVELTEAERCAFIPMKTLDFRNQQVVERFRAVLARAALTSTVAEILAYPAGTVRMSASAIHRPDVYPGPFRDMENIPTDRWRGDIMEIWDAFGGFHPRVTPEGQLVLPADYEVLELLFETSGSGFASAATITLDNRTTEHIPFSNVATLPQPVRLDALASIAISIDDHVEPDSHSFLWLIGRYRGSTGYYVFVPLQHFAAGVETVVLTCGASSADAVSHLIDNQLYYSQAVWQSLDPATIGIMLSQLTWPVGGEQRPLVELVDPTPVAVAANYLVLRLSGEGVEEEEKWLEQTNIRVGERREELVPIPSGGVFAEAVLGRSNSAERLEITRFWNWQDSPLPVTAPEIAPIAAGSRSEPDGTAPGQLGAPVVTVVAPPAVPDPAGLGAILTAIANGNMFRDMSGLAATIGLTQAGMAGAQQAATAAATQAGHNADTAAQLGAKVAELVADVAKTYIGKVGTAGGGLASLTGGLTGQGAKINQGQDMDKRNAAGRTGTGSAHPPVPGPPGGPRPDSTGGAGDPGPSIGHGGGRLVATRLPLSGRRLAPVTAVWRTPCSSRLPHGRLGPMALPAQTRVSGCTGPS